MWVMPSSSARCAQLPRAADKVPFYAALKKFRDYLNGLIPEIDENEMVFSEPKVKSCYEAEPKADLYPELTDISNAVIKTEDGTIIPCKKKRGRPKKIKIEGEEPPPKPVVRKPPPPSSNNCGDFPKKKRGRPKKVKMDSTEINRMENNAQANMAAQCFSNPSPIQSPNNFYPMGPAMTPPTSTGNMYNQPQAAVYNQSPRPPYSQSPRPPYSQSPRPTYSQSPRPAYSQSPRQQYNQSPRPQYSNSPRPPYSPRPHSQPFTHSDLSSEISAAISSEQLGSPGSPIGPPDFEPPTTMAEDAECRLSPAPSTNSENHHYHMSPAASANGEQPHSYHYQPYSMEPPSQEPPTQYPNTQQKHQDIASKSLSGLESLVDQIPSITDGEAPINETTDQYSNNYSVSSARASPVSYNYPSSGYPLYPTPTWSGPYEPMPLSYPQIPYPQSYTPGIHVPNPNYPYYSYPQPTPPHPPGYPPYLGGF